MAEAPSKKNPHNIVLLLNPQPHFHIIVMQLLERSINSIGHEKIVVQIVNIYLTDTT